MIGTTDYATTVNDNTLDILETEFDCIKESFVSEEFFRLAEVIRISYGLPLPSTLQNAINLFWLFIEVFNE